MAQDYVDRTGHEKLLVFVPQISPQTLLHLSIQGTSYALRDFLGVLEEPYDKGAGKEFKALDGRGSPILRTSEFEKQFNCEVKEDVRDIGIAVDKVERWQEIVRKRNSKYEIGS